MSQSYASASDIGMSQRKTKQMLLSSWVESSVSTDTQGSSGAVVSSTHCLPATTTRKTSVVTAVMSKEVSSEEALEESNEESTVLPTKSTMTVPTIMPSSNEASGSSEDFPEDNIQCGICCETAKLGNHKIHHL